jgi:site-specific recombinase XerD
MFRLAVDLAALLRSWQLELAADRKSPETIHAYTQGVTRFLRWCAEHDRVAVLDRPTVTAFVAGLLEGGAEGATARARLLALRRFSAWLAREGEIPVDEVAGMKPPRLDVKIVEALSDDQLRALIAACASTGNKLRDRRDEALIRFMVETGARAGEVVALKLADVHLAVGVATIRRGKGGKGRTVPFGPTTARALDRYIRVRRSHRLAASSPNLWLGDRGRPFSYDGLYKSLSMRARQAGIEGFHPHRLRHTAAHRWLAAGGSEVGLMAVAGWAKPDMLVRYTRSQASARAAEEARRLNLGDL